MAEAIISYVDDLVDAICNLAAALVGKASHPDNDDNDQGEE